jgi:hypothetical protein
VPVCKEPRGLAVRTFRYLAPSRTATSAVTQPSTSPIRSSHCRDCGPSRSAIDYPHTAGAVGKPDRTVEASGRLLKCVVIYDTFRM